MNDAAERAFAAADGVVLYGPRTGSKTRHHAIPPGLPPGPLAPLLKARVLQVSSLRPGLSCKVKGKITGTVERWREMLEVNPGSDAEILARFENGDPALLGAGRHHYLAGWPDAKLLASLMKLMASRAGLKPTKLPPGIRLRRRGNLLFVMNYGDEPWALPKSGKLLLGSRKLQPQDVAILETGS